MRNARKCVFLLHKAVLNDLFEAFIVKMISENWISQNSNLLVQWVYVRPVPAVRQNEIFETTVAKTIYWLSHKIGFTTIKPNFSGPVEQEAREASLPASSIYANSGNFPP